MCRYLMSFLSHLSVTKWHCYSDGLCFSHPQLRFLYFSAFTELMSDSGLLRCHLSLWKRRLFDNISYDTLGWNILRYILKSSFTGMQRLLTNQTLKPLKVVSQFSRRSSTMDEFGSNGLHWLKQRQAAASKKSGLESIILFIFGVILRHWIRTSNTFLFFVC